MGYVRGENGERMLPCVENRERVGVCNMREGAREYVCL